MNIEYLIQLLENKMIVLTNTKAQSFMIGDLVSINNIDTEIAEVNDTLYKLRLLLSASLEVGSINTNLVEAMKLKPQIITDGSTDCLNYYDITSYATDPLHEQKIVDILQSMGPMVSPETIDAYIDSEAIASPVTGAMILNAAQIYNVDVRLMMAIMELDSRFGTAGVAVSTFNPGNVGNTGTATRSYASWEDGVAAVAAWLNNHRINVEVPQETPMVEVPPIVPVSEEILPVQPIVPTPEVTPIPEEIIPIKPETESVIPTSIDSMLSDKVQAKARK